MLAQMEDDSPFNLGGILIVVLVFLAFWCVGYLLDCGDPVGQGGAHFFRSPSPDCRCYDCETRRGRPPPI